MAFDTVLLKNGSDISLVIESLLGRQCEGKAEGECQDENRFHIHRVKLG